MYGGGKGGERRSPAIGLLLPQMYYAIVSPVLVLYYILNLVSHYGYFIRQKGGK